MGYVTCVRKKTSSGRVKRKTRKANGAEIKRVLQWKGDKNQGEFGDQVNIMNQKQLSQ